MLSTQEDSLTSIQFEMINIDPDNMKKHGFFCYKSKRKSPGYQRKLTWLEQRFAEGLKIKLLYHGGRQVGFIEYMPGESAWRAVQAPDYMGIHCLWVVGRAKKKGFGSRLLEVCIDDARQQKKAGVTMVASGGNWLAGPKLFVKHGFEAVDQAPPSFELLVHRFRDAPLPTFPKDWGPRLRRFGPGLTIARTDQCPYIENATIAALRAAHEAGVEARVLEWDDRQDVQEWSPSPYGVLAMVYNGRLLSYHMLSTKELLERLSERVEPQA